MKPYNSIIHSVLIVGLILVCFYLYIELKTTKELLSGIVSAMNPNKTKPDDLNETHVSILLTFIGIGFALFAFLTFQSVKDFFHSKITEIKKKQDEKDAEHYHQVHKLNELENNVISVTSIMMTDHATENFKDGNDWLGLYHSLNAVQMYSKKNIINDTDKADRDDIVESMLQDLLAKITKNIQMNAETKAQVEAISQTIIINSGIKAAVLLTKIIEKCEVIKK